jgi:hypothetical protein
MTGIVKTDQLQGAQGTTVTVPTGHTLAVTGAFTSQGIDDNANATAITIDSNEDITITKQGTNTTDVRFANSSNSFGGNIKYDHNVGNMIFNVHNGERVRFRSDGGICFNGDTAAANALDDYEEGTFTPSLTGSYGNRQGTWSSLVGRYLKVGRLVYLHISIAGSGMYFDSERGFQQIAGTPFAADMSQSGSANYSGSWSSGNVSHSIAGATYIHGSSIYIHSANDNWNTSGTGSIGVCITYVTA